MKKYSLVVASIILLTGVSTRAENFYWNSDSTMSGTWSNGSNWWTVLGDRHIGNVWGVPPEVHDSVSIEDYGVSPVISGMSVTLNDVYIGVGNYKDFSYNPGASPKLSLSNGASLNSSGEVMVGYLLSDTSWLDTSTWNAQVNLTGTSTWTHTGTFFAATGIAATLTVSEGSAINVNGDLVIGDTQNRGKFNLSLFNNARLIVSDTFGTTTSDAVEGINLSVNNSLLQAGDIVLSSSFSSLLSVTGSNGRVIANNTVIASGTETEMSLGISDKALWESTGSFTAASGSDSKLNLAIGSSATLNTGVTSLASGDGSRVDVDMTGSAVWRATGSLSVASGTASAFGINLRSSSTLTADTLSLSEGVAATGSIQLTGSSVINAGNLFIASGSGAYGKITLREGSSLANGDAEIAGGANSDAEITITNDNSKWVTNGNLVLAKSGITDLNVGFGGEVTVSGTMTVAADAGSEARLLVTRGGRLNVGELTIGSGSAKLDIGGDSVLGKVTSTAPIELLLGGTTGGDTVKFNDVNNYVGNTTIRFKTNVVFENKNARFGTGDLLNSGLITLQNGGTLTVNGNYTGASGAAIEIGKGFASGGIDQIVITGNATGQTALRLVGLGKKSSALPGGELTLIDVGGVSDENAFVLDGGPQVYAGLYSYSFQQRGEDWVLISTKNTDAANAILNTAGASAITWFTQMGNLNKRLGEIRYQEEQTLLDYIKNGAKGGKSSVDFWVKAYGQQSNVKLGISGLGHFTDYVYGIDVGADKAWQLDANNSVSTGYFLGYGGNQRDFKRNGNGESTNYYTGFYGTWLNKAGWFADLIVKGQYSSNEFDATSGRDANFHDRGNYHNWAAGATLEAGKRFQFKNGLFVEPSVQVSYLRLFNGNYESDVAYVKISDADIARIWGGARAGWSFKVHESGNILQPYIRVGALEQVSSGNKVQIGGDTDDTWRVNTDGFHIVGGAGLMFQITDIDQLHLDYEAAFGDKYDVPWNLNLGYRHQF